MDEFFFKRNKVLLLAAAAAIILALLLLQPKAPEQPAVQPVAKPITPPVIPTPAPPAERPDDSTVYQEAINNLNLTECKRIYNARLRDSCNSVVMSIIEAREGS